MKQKAGTVNIQNLDSFWWVPMVGYGRITESIFLSRRYISETPGCKTQLRLPTLRQSPLSASRQIDKFFVVEIN